MVRIVNNCQLEIDDEIGVLYVTGPDSKILVRANRTGVNDPYVYTSQIEPSDPYVYTSEVPSD